LLTKRRPARINCMDMPPLTSPDKPLNSLFWRLLLLLACVLVFSFALHAKVAVYGHIQPQPSTSSKMWMNGTRFEVPDLTSSAVLLWLAVLSIPLFYRKSAGRFEAAPVALAREPSRREQYLRRFLRPPPLQ